jgi:hypothetical protein
MRFLDTERLLPNPDDPRIKGTRGFRFETSYAENDQGPSTELGFAYNGVSPFYMASALYAVKRYINPFRRNKVQAQIAPFINCGIKAGSFSSITSVMTKDAFYGTYFWGWRMQLNLGTVVTNPVGGHLFIRDNDMIERAYTNKRKRVNRLTRAARFKGAWGAERGGRKLICTLCGYYSGIENVSGYQHWGIEKGRADDGGLAFSRLAGYRAKMVDPPKVPCQLAKHVWAKASRILRAYTGFVAQTLGSSSYSSTVYMFANGCWEQVFGSDPYVLGLEFSEYLSDRVELGGRGASKFHMLDLLDLGRNQNRLTHEVVDWHGSHPQFLGNLYKIVDLEVSSFNGDSGKGTVTRIVPYVDLENGEQLSLLAKCRRFVGGIRSVLTNVKYERHAEDKFVEHSSEAIFNASCVTTDTPGTATTVFENLFVIEPPATKTEVLSDQLFDSRTAAPPVPRSSHSERVKRTPSVETFPNADVKDDGLMPQVSSVKVTNSTDSFRLTITLSDGGERSVNFMPVSVLLADARNQVLASHNKVAAGNYGYGFLAEDPYSENYGIEIFNTAPGVDSYNAQERWHVPYKDLIKVSWEIAIGPLSPIGFSQGGATPKENPYIFKKISDSNPANRYTAYDLQIRPPTFLPLFMTAEVCHEGGATAFARALAEGLVESLSLSISDTTVTFTQPPPDWAKDARAYRESIVTLLLLGGYTVTEVVDENNVSTVVEYSDDAPFRGSPSDSFWRLLAEATGLDSVSDLITHFGVSDGVANIPSSVVIAAAVKDPIAFGASMGITVVRVGDGYMIGTHYYPDLASVVAELTDIAMRVIAVDRTNVENITTSLGYPLGTNEIEAQPKRYATPFNWLLLLPHVTTAAIMVATKVTQRKHLGK